MNIKQKKAVFAIIGVFVLAFLVIGIPFIVKTEAVKQKQKREETASIFTAYRQYGLVYDKKTDRLYFNDQLVRYFEDTTSDDHYKKWPNKDGTVDVFAKHSAAGGLIGIEPFDQQAFADRTAELQDAVCELQITENMDIGGYTPEIEEQVEDRIEAAYTVYQQYGLTYDRGSSRLYYNGELVGYFEDQAIGHFFGPFEDSNIRIYAKRDSRGNLTGLDVENDME